MELSPPLHLGVVVIEKGALTKVANFTYFIEQIVGKNGFSRISV